MGSRPRGGFEPRCRRLRHRHGGRLIDLRRHRLTQSPGDGHRPVPFVRDVVSRTQEHIWRRAKRIGFCLPHEKQDVRTALAMMDVALPGAATTTTLSTATPSGTALG